VVVPTNPEYKIIVAPRRTTTMKTKLPVLVLLCLALIPALSACGDNALKDATPSANAAEVASVTPVTQPNVGLGATAQANVLTAVVSNPTPITGLTPSPATSATPSPTPTPTPTP
jgi:hypothetical protein